MKTKNAISVQLTNYEKTYDETRDFDEFKANVYQAIADIEQITPVSPTNSSFLFQVKLDYENMDRNSSPHVLSSLKNFLDRLELQ